MLHQGYELGGTQHRQGQFANVVKTSVRCVRKQAKSGLKTQPIANRFLHVTASDRLWKSPLLVDQITF
jgi:hypothetical protein